MTDGLGAFTICQWNEILLEVQESGRANVQFSSELQSASAVLPSTPLFSCPLYLPRRASWERRPLASEAQIDTTEANDCCLGREVRTLKFPLVQITVHLISHFLSYFSSVCHAAKLRFQK